MDGTTAFVLMFNSRYFHKFGKGGRIQTAWSLPGAALWGDWEVEEMNHVKEDLEAKGHTVHVLKVGHITE